MVDPELGRKLAIALKAYSGILDEQSNIVRKLEQTATSSNSNTDILDTIIPTLVFCWARISRLFKSLKGQWIMWLELMPNSSIICCASGVSDHPHRRGAY
jgi:hypothetical protein